MPEWLLERLRDLDLRGDHLQDAVGDLSQVLDEFRDSASNAAQVDRRWDVAAALVKWRTRTIESVVASEYGSLAVTHGESPPRSEKPPRIPLRIPLIVVAAFIALGLGLWSIHAFVPPTGLRNGGSRIAKDTTIVPPVNKAPVAVDDDASTPEDTPVTIDVTANDSDLDGDALAIIETTQATNGTTTVSGLGTVAFAPAPNFNGTGSFTYTIDDGNGGSDTAQVTITVTSVNDAPVAVDDSATTDEDTPVTIDVTANDGDPDGDALTIVAVTQAANGAAAINPAGGVTYTPAANFNATDSFTYTIDDGNGGSDTAQVTITVAPVNDPPNASEHSMTIAPREPKDFYAANHVSEVESGSRLRFFLHRDATYGIVKLKTGGLFTYAPPQEKNEDTFEDSFEYGVLDEANSDAHARVTIRLSDQSQFMEKAPTRRVRGDRLLVRQMSGDEIHHA